VEVLDFYPDDREASICRGSQRSGSTAPHGKHAKVDHKAQIRKI